MFFAPKVKNRYVLPVFSYFEKNCFSIFVMP